MSVGVGVGILTWRRPDFYEVCATTAVKHFGDCEIVAYHDGPLEAPYPTTEVDLLVGGVNRGCAFAKNVLVRHFLATGCRWVFVAEDDVAFDDPLAVHGYIAACEASGYEHLAFHAHGPGNPPHTGTHDGGPVSYWPNSVGAWCCWSASALIGVGLMDDAMVNGMEHVEHTMRLAAAGFTSGLPRGFADATGSERWLHEQPGAIEASVICARPDHRDNIARARARWRETRPDTYYRVWPNEQVSG